MGHCSWCWRSCSVSSASRDLLAIRDPFAGRRRSGRERQPGELFHWAHDFRSFHPNEITRVVHLPDPDSKEASVRHCRLAVEWLEFSSGRLHLVPYKSRVVLYTFDCVVEGKPHTWIGVSIDAAPFRTSRAHATLSVYGTLLDMPYSFNSLDESFFALTHCPPGVPVSEVSLVVVLRLSLTRCH